jgi:MYXO-CTERM domain-containing protein
MIKVLLSLALGCVALRGSAHGANINIDFDSTGNNTHTGLAAAPDTAGAGAFWNPLSNVSGTASALALDDSNGVTTGVGFSLTGISGSIAAATGEQERSSAHLNLMRDYLRIDSGSSTAIVSVTGLFTGLTAGATYDLYFYGQGENFGAGTVSGGTATQGQNSLFTVNGNSAQTGWDGTVGGDGALAEGVEYVKFTVVADGAGEIEFLWSNVVQGTGGNVTTDSAPSTAVSGTQASRYAALNGIQLVSVPEPSTALLGALGLCGLLGRRRRPAI